MPELNAHGEITDDRRVKVSIDLGFGTIAFDLEQDALNDSANAALLEDVVMNLEGTLADLFVALLAASNAKKAAGG